MLGIINFYPAGHPEEAVIAFHVDDLKNLIEQKGWQGYTLVFKRPNESSCLSLSVAIQELTGWNNKECEEYALGSAENYVVFSFQVKNRPPLPVAESS